ncbi:MAG: hypothetical protein K6D94_08325, partial [Clostridiales bacterium]|nr:hypothetical protein [Clostridiales bacterium]
MIIRRTACALLLSALVLSLFAACGSAAGDVPASTTAPQGGELAETEAAETLSDLEMRALVDDELPEADFGGYTWRIVTQDTYKNHYYMEEEDGDVIDDAVYGRNLRVAERYNINYAVAFEGSYEECNSFVKKAVTAGDDSFDVISMHVVSLSGCAVNGYFMNMYDLPHINFEKPWWGQSNIDDLTYHGVALMGVGNYGLNSIGQTYCMFFDKKSVADYDLGDMYAIVNDGKWTIDNLTGMTSEIYQDLNANEKRDIEDFYGFATNPYSHINAYLWAFDNPVCAVDSNGDISVVIHTPKMAEILEKLVKITHEYVGTYYDPSYTSPTNLGAHGGPVDLFRRGGAIFANGLFEYAIYYYREVNDFGIIPYPKWDEQQEKYQMMVDGGHAAEAVPMTCQDPERTGTILEALNAETYKTVVPAYYEIALKVKYARDNESIQMLDMIMANRVFDFGYVYDNWNGAS